MGRDFCDQAGRRLLARNTQTVRRHGCGQGVHLEQDRQGAMRALMQTELERRRERRQIVTGNWPHFPVLPVKRHTPRSYRPEIGVIFWDREIETKPIQVYLTNL